MAQPVPLVLPTASSSLGEGCIWDESAGALYWVDIEDRVIHRFVPQEGTQERWHLPERIGSIGLRKGRGLIAALESGFAFIDLYPLTITRLAQPESPALGTRFNDGRVDRAGRFWSGTMDDAQSRALGSLYRLDPNLSWRRMETGIVISNSIAWSPDGTRLYFADSKAGVIWAYAHDPVSGEIGQRRVFARVEAGGGPDGSCVDAQGYLWNAQWGHSRVRRYAPDGRVDRDIMLPVTQPSCCCFGGPDLRTLFITTASIGLTLDQLRAQKNAGRVFQVMFTESDGIQGLPESRFGT